MNGWEIAYFMLIGLAFAYVAHNAVWFAWKKCEGEVMKIRIAFLLFVFRLKQKNHIKAERAKLHDNPIKEISFSDLFPEDKNPDAPFGRSGPNGGKRG